MTKLEEKVVELGYKPSWIGWETNYFVKFYDDKWNLIIGTGMYGTNVIECYVDLDGMAIYTQQDLEDLQQAFNVMQKDLKGLKKYENNRFNNKTNH